MHFDLGSHVKSRSRSAQLEKTLMNMAALGSISFKDGKRSLRTLSASRSGNLPLVENTTITNIAHGQGESSVSGTSTPGSTRESIRETIRGGFRGSLRGGRASMLEVEDMAPKLSPVKPMTYEELYVKPDPEPEPASAFQALDDPEAEDPEEEDDEDEETDEGDDTVVQEPAPRPQVIFC